MVNSLKLNKSMKGFTLLELIVAMAIFATLAVAGWQVFDSITRSKERAEVQLTVVTELQYGYQQMQRDMFQVVDYKLPSANAKNGDELQPSNNQNAEQTPQANSNDDDLKGAFSLANNRLSFIRHADPDPRYAQSASFERIVYLFDNGNLIRERYTTLDDASNEKPLRSIVVSSVSNGRFQVLLPEPSIVFPNIDVSNQAGSLPASEGALKQPVPTLPKGVIVNFNIQFGNVDTPIEWIYAISKTAPNPQAAKKIEAPADNGQDEDET